MIRFGFGKQDITPRLGVELTGYSGYLNRYASAVRDPLLARAMAVSDGTRTAVIVSNDLVYVTRDVTAEVRRLVHRETGLDAASIMVHATHTHSGPCLQLSYRNAYDPPWVELLPRRIARACIDAVKALQPAELHHAVVPCEGMATNRVYDKFNYGEAALREGFRPAMPERTDTTCHVLKVVADGRVIGFASCFGCHNVVGGGASTYLHGDYAGIATGMLEREHPGAIGLFLQGAEGDVNSAICCLGDDQVLPALDIMASRYARAVRHGLDAAAPVDADTVGATRRELSFSRRQVPLAELEAKLAAEQAVIDAPGADDQDRGFRMAILRRICLRSIIERVKAGVTFENTTEVQGLRLGPVTLLGAPMEVFQAIKNEIVERALAPIPLVLSVTNDEQGYAVDREKANDETDYAARTVPLWKHTLPYRDIHTELVQALLGLDQGLNQPPV